jgi:hypothetical protein
VRVDEFGIVGDGLEEDGVLAEELPVEFKSPLVLVDVGSLVLLGLAMAEEENVVV